MGSWGTRGPSGPASRSAICRTLGLGFIGSGAAEAGAVRDRAKRAIILGRGPDGTILRTSNGARARARMRTMRSVGPWSVCARVASRARLRDRRALVMVTAAAVQRRMRQALRGRSMPRRALMGRVRMGGKLS